MSLVLFVIYEVGAVAVWSTTVGKAAVGLSIERASDGTRPEWRGAGLRYTALAAPGLIADLALSDPARDTFSALYLLLLSASVVVGEGHRGLHDRFADTVVVHASADS